MNFATLQGLTIPEGVVTQITDASGRVIWSAGGKPIVLEVEKITSDTYAAETTYAGEQFILLSIHSLLGGTVKVTYGGLTKEVIGSAVGTRVFFGTFNGVSDSVPTPSSGELTIEGADYIGVSSFNYANKKTRYCGCITNVIDWGGWSTSIPSYAFSDCFKLAIDVIPEGIKEIGSCAFLMSESRTSYGITHIVLPSTIETIGATPFDYTFSEHNETRYLTYVKTVTMLATTPPTVPTSSYGGESLFSATPPSIIVPKGYGEVYKTADGWSRYASYITEAT